MCQIKIQWLKKKKEWVLRFFTCDKIFEIRIKNLTILQYKINRPSYMLIKKKNIGVVYSTYRLRAKWLSYSNWDMNKEKINISIIVTPSNPRKIMDCQRIKSQKNTGSEMKRWCHTILTHAIPWNWWPE